MPMQLPKPNAEAVALFEAIRPRTPQVTVRAVFGQPAAFVNGQMFLGVFGEHVFLRLSEADRARAAEIADARPFEPMPGRPMREYVVLPPSTIADPALGAEWVGRSLEFARGLPAKKPSRARTPGPKPADRARPRAAASPRRRT